MSIDMARCFFMPNTLCKSLVVTAMERLYRRFFKFGVLGGKVKGKNIFFPHVSSYAPNRLGPVLIESSGDCTTPRYPEHCQTPSELGDTP